jgi:hypothetical protein
MAWNSLNISNFLGIASSKRKPLKNEAIAVDNLDPRGTSGDLTTRKYYEQIYSAPTHASLSSNTQLGAENIYVPDIGGGQEVTVAVSKATLSGTNIICIWASHQWNGSSWTTGWHWLNECVKTTVTSRTSYVVATGLTITNGQYDGWYVYNVTKQQYARVFISKAPNEIRLTDSTGTWDASDALILMRNYIPYEYLTGNYAATANDIVFHKVLNGLRIGFGGQSGRAGLAVMYVNNTKNITSFDFGDSDYSNTTNLNNFKTVNRIICEVYNQRPTTSAIVNMTASEVRNDDNLSYGNYQVKVTSVLDGYNHFVQPNDYSFVSNADYFICEFTPQIATFSGFHRVSGLNIFLKKDDGVFNLSKTLNLTEVEYKINTDGYLYPALVSESELYTFSDAASVDEANTVGTWVANEGTAGVETSSPLSGSYSLKVTGDNRLEIATPTPLSISDTALRVKCKVKAPVGTNCSICLSDSSFMGVKPPPGVHLYYNFTATGSTQDIDYTFNVPDLGIDHVIAVFSGVGTSATAYIDSLSILMVAPFALRILDLPQTIESIIGYTPTTSYLMSWDHAIVSSGKTLFMSPYIDQRYTSKIFASVIGAGFQYDVAIAANYYDLENFDGNDLVGMAVLANLDIIAFKQNSIQYLDSSSGSSRNLEVGTGCVNRRSIVQIGPRIFWAGENGIFATDGNSVEDVTKDSIRQSYLGLAKTNLRASYDELDLSYVFTATGLAEFMLTPRGWVTRDSSSQSISYLRSKNGDMWRYGSGGIYGPTSTYISDGYTFVWKSIVLDAGQEELPENQRFKIKSYWIDYIAGGNITLTAKIYLDGVLYTTQAFALTSGEKRAFYRLPLVVESPVRGNNCKRFQIELSAPITSASLTLKALGVEWHAIPEGINA